MAENYKNESMVDVAYGVLKDFGNVTKFSDLYKEVSYRLEFTDQDRFQNISKFYTDLTLDGRFITVGENEWDLRENRRFEETSININEVYKEIEDEERANIDKSEFDEEELKAAGLDDEEEDEEDQDSFDYDAPKQD